MKQPKEFTPHCLVQYSATGPVISLQGKFGRYRFRDASGWHIVTFGVGREETKCSDANIRPATVALGKVLATYGAGAYGTVELRQKGKGKLCVVYGVQATEKLSYGAAARTLGESLMHALACESDELRHEGSFQP